MELDKFIAVDSQAQAEQLEFPDLLNNSAETTLFPKARSVYSVFFQQSATIDYKIVCTQKSYNKTKKPTIKQKSLSV